MHIQPKDCNVNTYSQIHGVQMYTHYHALSLCLCSIVWRNITFLQSVHRGQLKLKIQTQALQALPPVTLLPHEHCFHPKPSREYGSCSCENYRTEVEEYEGTVIYRTLLFHNSVFLGKYEKTYLNLLLFFSSFYNSGLFYNNCVFPHVSHIYQFRSIYIYIQLFFPF